MSCVSVASVIVTYGNRFHLVKQVMSAALEEGVSQIVLVDNASVEESRKELDSFIAVEPRVILVRHLENLGSAGGFHSGLAYVVENLNTDFIWILDDDNIPQKKALKNLLNARDLLITKECEDVVVYSYRGAIWQDDVLAVTQGRIKCYHPNNFMGFNLCNSLKNKIKNFFDNAKNEEVNYPLVRCYVGPYGGMLLSFNVLKKVGLPNKEFYLYADDHEFSSRFEKEKIKQYLVHSSELVDIDISFTDNNRFFGKNSSEFKLFYGIRNHVFLSQNDKKNELIYIINKSANILLILLKSFSFLLKDVKLYLRRLSLIRKAISDGQKGRLGKTF